MPRRAQLQRVRELDARVAGRAAGADPGAAPGRPGARRVGGALRQGDRDAAPGPRGRDRAASRPGSRPRSTPTATQRCCGSPQEALHNAVRHAAARHVTVTLSRVATAAAADDRRRRHRLRSARSGAAISAARPDLDGGARAGARRRTDRPLGGRPRDDRHVEPAGDTATPAHGNRRAGDDADADSGADRRRPRGRARGPAHVPRTAGRDRGRRRGGRRPRRRSSRGRRSRPT